MNNFNKAIRLGFIKRVGSGGFAMLAVLCSHMAKDDYNPKVNEMAKELGISRQTASKRINKLIKQGLITREAYSEPATLPHIIFVYVPSDLVAQIFSVDKPNDAHVRLAYKRRRMDVMEQIYDSDLPEPIKLKEINRILDNPVGIKEPPVKLKNTN